MVMRYDYNFLIVANKTKYVLCTFKSSDHYSGATWRMGINHRLSMHFVKNHYKVKLLQFSSI
jgi:hypothetical protein